MVHQSFEVRKLTFYARNWISFRCPIIQLQSNVFYSIKLKPILKIMIRYLLPFNYINIYMSEAQTIMNWCWSLKQIWEHHKKPSVIKIFDTCTWSFFKVLLVFNSHIIIVHIYVLIHVYLCNDQITIFSIFVISVTIFAVQKFKISYNYFEIHPIPPLFIPKSPSCSKEYPRYF
jgi:hypothetical protein